MVGKQHKNITPIYIFSHKKGVGGLAMAGEQNITHKSPFFPKSGRLSAPSGAAKTALFP